MKWVEQFGDTYETEGEAISSVDEVKERLPYRPYCANCFDDGRKILPRNLALKYRYIQLNPPYMVNFIAFDLDYETWPFVSDDVSLPPPLWFVQNQKNGHAHLIYGLAKPVCTSEKAHDKPRKIIEAIVRAYREKLGADPCYAGLYSKNPFSDYWRVVQVCEMLYSLEYLAGFVELSFTKRKRNTLSDEDYAALGRHCWLFVSVKNWAYREIKRYWGKGSADWSNAVLYQAHCENMRKYPDNPLPDNHVKSTAKSIATWTWRHFTPERFSEIQRGRKAKWTAKYSEKNTGLELMKQGFSTAEISKELGVTPRIVRMWRNEQKEAEILQRLGI